MADFERMAKLKLDDSEREVVKKRFDAVCGEFKKLEQYDTNEALPLVTVLDLENTMRDDISEKYISRDVLLTNAPEQQDGYIRVPASID